MTHLVIWMKGRPKKPVSGKIFFRNNQLSGTVINTSYLTGSYIVFTLKMESVPEITMFGLQMMIKSGLEKIFLKLLNAGAIFS